MSTVAIIVDGNDVTSEVLFATATFEQQMNAVPGTFSFTVRDPNRTLSFSTGKEVSLDVDGLRMFGGYLTQVSMIHLAPAADTSDLGDYNLRAWLLKGTDYNIIFDRRVVRNTADYLSSIHLTELTDGAELRSIVDNYSDCSDFSTAGIEDIADIPGDEDFIQQGTKLRQWFENLSFFGGAVWYIDGNKNFIYTPFESVTKTWGFSDAPNHVTSIGFRQVEAVEDGSYIQNDALIWGGSEFAGSGGGTVFARVQDATSQSTYGRWQIGETHFGELHYKTQVGVDARANVIVLGPPGADIEGQQKGLRYSQWQFTFTWFSVDVPAADHVVPGDIMDIEMTVFGVNKLLPLRSLRISFPDAFVNDGTHLVEFHGTFGLQLSDPFTLWRYLLKVQNRIGVGAALSPAAVTSSSTSTVYGAMFQGAPTPTPNGAATVFSIPFGYISGSVQLYKNGLIQRPGIDFNETDAVAGEITTLFVPSALDTLYIVCTTLAS